jgi:hypothetical protein
MDFTGDGNDGIEVCGPNGEGEACAKNPLNLDRMMKMV